MTLTPSWYENRPEPVAAVQVTEDNADVVAQWAEGSVIQRRGHLVVVITLNTGQRREAHAGMWLTRNPRNGQIRPYTDEDFQDRYQPSEA